MVTESTPAQPPAHRIGAISWSYADWKGSFYPPKVASEDMLSRYARVFDAVEVDNTFYRMPKTDVVEAWDAATPPGFTFCTKMRGSVLKPSSLIDEAPRGIQAFLDRMEPIRRTGKLGPILLQFPPFFKRKKWGEAFDTFVRALPRDIKWAVELRDEGWWADETYAAMREAGASLVWSMTEYPSFPPVTTADWVYSRLIGDRELTEFDRTQRDKRADIESWKARLDAAPNVREAFTFVSNRFTGYAPEAIHVVQDVLGVPRTDLSPAARAEGQQGLALD